MCLVKLCYLKNCGSSRPDWVEDIGFAKPEACVAVRVDMQQPVTRKKVLV